MSVGFFVSVLVVDRHTGSVCVCVCCRPIYSERRFSPLGRVSRGHTGGRPTHRRFFFFFLFVFWFSTFLLRCLPFFFIARRVQHSLSLVDREVECCVPATKSLSTVGCCARKNPRLLRDLNPRPNRQKVTRLPTEPPGRPAMRVIFYDMTPKFRVMLESHTATTVCSG